MIEGSRRGGPFDVRWQLRDSLPAVVAAPDSDSARWNAQDRAESDAENEGMPPKPESQFVSFEELTSTGTLGRQYEFSNAHRVKVFTTEPGSEPGK